MKWALVVIGLIVLLVVVVTLVGAALPRDHVAARTAHIDAAPLDVWSALTTPADFPKWRTDVTRVELLPSGPTGPSWREFAKHGVLTMQTDTADPPRRLVTRIADKGLPYGGAWEYRIEPDGPLASRVTITEHGSVYNPIFRFVSRFVIGHTATIDTYLRQLGNRFGTRTPPAIAIAPAESRGR